MPRRRRRIPGPRLLMAILLILLLSLALSWWFGNRRVEPGGGPEPTTMKTASMGDGGPVVQVLRPVVAPRPGRGRTGEPVRFERAVRPDPLEGRSWLRGRVVDAEGRPLKADVVVERALSEEAFPSLPAARLGEATTDDDGRWTVGFLPPDDVVHVVAWLEGVPHVAETLPRVPPWSVVDLGELRETPRRRFRIRRRGYQVLRPVTETALGAAPILVDEHTLVPAGPHRFLEPEEIDVAVGAGDWELIVLRENALPVRLALDGEPVLPPAAAPARRELAIGGEVPAWVLHETPDGAVTSMAVGGERTVRVPTTGSVRVLFAGSEPFEVESGAARVEPPPLGEVTVAVRPSGLRFEPAADAPRLRAAIAATQMADAAAFPLAPGRYRALARGAAAATFEVWAGKRTAVDALSATGRTLRGSVTDARTGEPCAGATIVVGAGVGALMTESPAPTTLTDAAGRFEVAGLPAGSLDVIVRSPRHLPRTQRIVLGEDDAAAVALSVTLDPGPGVEVRLSEPALGVAAIDRHGHVIRAESDAAGVARLGAMTRGRWVVFVVSGRLAVPADAWDWLVTRSGGRVVDVGDEALVLDWELPAPRSWSGEVVLENAPRDRFALRIVHAGEAPSPGVWPDLEFTDVRPGPVRIDRLFPGRYRAIATVGERSEVVDFDLAAEGPGPGALVFAFPEEN